MEKPTVYIETTVPSAYLDERTAPAMVDRRTCTREWWSLAASRYVMMGSPVLIRELSIGTPPRVRTRLALVAGLRMLEHSFEVQEVAERYVRHKLMPANPSADAFHLAFASVYACHFLVSWNYRHLGGSHGDPLSV